MLEKRKDGRWIRNSIGLSEKVNFELKFIGWEGIKQRKKKKQKTITGEAIQAESAVQLCTKQQQAWCRVLEPEGTHCTRD